MGGCHLSGRLAELSKDERQAWRDAFSKIQEGRRGGVSPGLAWVEILRRGVEDRGKRKRG